MVRFIYNQLGGNYYEYNNKSSFKKCIKQYDKVGHRPLQYRFYNR
ncbi:hypothetical protein F10086_184 [Staphylococcus phage vB_SauM_JDF86]|nr:hypothetical protein F10086_184 [Staphylococcus phage vB_SauM_JDF86]